MTLGTESTRWGDSQSLTVQVGQDRAPDGQRTKSPPGKAPHRTARPLAHDRTSRASGKCRGIEEWGLAPPSSAVPAPLFLRRAAILLARGTRTKKLCSFDARTVRISQASCPSESEKGLGGLSRALFALTEKHSCSENQIRFSENRFGFRQNVVWTTHCEVEQ